MTKPLGEIRVCEEDRCIALIVRTTRKFFPWEAWTIVEPNDRFSDDPTIGSHDFEPIRPLERFYSYKVHYWARRVGMRHRQSAAEKASKRALTKFLTWRAKQEEIIKTLITGQPQ